MAPIPVAQIDLGAENQLWLAEQQADGFFKLRSKVSGRCLDVVAMSVSDGARIQLWDDLDGENQKWMLIPVSAPKAEKPVEEKKAPARKPAAKKAPAKKPAAEKAPAEKKTAAAKKTAAKKPAEEKNAAEKAPAEKKSAAAKKPAGEKAPAEKKPAAARKTPAKKTTK